MPAVLYCNRKIPRPQVFQELDGGELFSASPKGREKRMGYQIAVCDDNQEDAGYVASLVQAWAVQGRIQAEIRIFPSAEAFLFEYGDNKNYDMLLLDIEMGKMDGVSLAKKLRQENEMLQIIFVTGYSDYIAEGYEVSALHYLIKPVGKEKLFSVLDRAADRLRRDERVLDVRSSGELLRIPLRQIRYADVRLNYLTIHAKTDVTVKMPLGELEKMLDERFYRAGRSLIVNLTCIGRVTRTDIYLQDGERLPLPGKAYQGINRAIMERVTK